MEFSAAVVLAFVTGLTVGYFLNKRFVFTRSKNSVAKEMMWFLLINLFALLQTWALSLYLAQFLSENLVEYVGSPRVWSEAIAHGAGIFLPVFTSYIGHRYLTFRE
ncbi:MAG: putative flippase GtrA [Halioglobus sp.]|jgi:putative flippase GtrA